MTTGRAAGAQFGLEARARAAVLATAEEIRADDVPPAPPWRPGAGSANTGPGGAAPADTGPADTAPGGAVLAGRGRRSRRAGRV